MGPENKMSEALNTWKALREPLFDEKHCEQCLYFDPADDTKDELPPRCDACIKSSFADDSHLPNWEWDCKTYE